MSTRRYCPACHYPLVTCLCAFIAPVDSQIKISILQHPSEVKAAKNTARLAQLCLANTNIWVGESADDFNEIQQNIMQDLHKPHTIAVLYPNTKSIDLQRFKARRHLAQRTHSAPPLHLIFLDGTWRKAYKMWQLNPWLHNLDSITISQMSSQYHIRKAPKEGCLSTLEAIDYCLKELDDCKSSVLLKLFLAMQQPFLQHRSR
jgi:DTW domain-containing protein YfiP